MKSQLHNQIPMFSQLHLMFPTNFCNYLKNLQKYHLQKNYMVWQALQSVIEIYDKVWQYDYKVC